MHLPPIFLPSGRAINSLTLLTKPPSIVLKSRHRDGDLGWDAKVRKHPHLHRTNKSQTLSQQMATTSSTIF